MSKSKITDEQNDWIYSCAQKYGIDLDQFEGRCEVNITNTGFGFKRTIDLVDKKTGSLFAKGNFAYKESNCGWDCAWKLSSEMLNFETFL